MLRTTLTFVLALLGSVAVRAEQKTPPKKAGQSAAVNFTDHVLPIFRQHCLNCHNANDAEGGLAIDTYGGLMEGGGSGDAVSAGDASGSRLYQVMTHAEEPTMPPNQDPLPKEQLEIIEKWIAGGLLENSGSKVRKKKGPSLTFTAMDASGKPSVIAMPETAWRVPVVTTQRAAAASAIAASPWAPLVAVAGQRQVAMYNTDTGELAGIIPYPEGIPQVLQFSSDGAYLLVAGGTHASKGTASIYDVRTGERILAVGDELDTVFGADTNDSMSSVALGGPQRIVRVFDTATGDVRFELKKHTDWVYCVDYSPDGVLVASGDRSGGLHVWEADTGRLYLDLVGHKGAIRGISWRADSNVLVSASEDGTVKLWEMNGGKQLKSFNAHSGGATGVMMAKDGRIVTCGKDKTVKLWKADGAAITKMPAFSETALEAVITHDGSKLVGGDWTGRVVMWTIADPKQSWELPANPPRLEDQQVQLASQIAELEKLASAAVASENKQRKGAEAAKAAHQGLVTQVSQTKALLAKVNADKVAAEKLLAELTKQKAAAGSKLKAAEVLVGNLRKTIKDATAKQNSQKQTLAALTANRKEANEQKASILAEIAKFGKEFEELKASAVASIASIAERELDVATKEQVAATKETDAEAARRAAESVVADLNGRIAAVSETIGKLKQEVMTSEAESKALVAKIADLPGKVEAAKNKLDANQAELTKAQKALDASKGEEPKADLTEKVEKLKLAVGASKKSIVSLEKSLSDAKAKKSANENRISDLNSRLAATVSEQKELQGKLNEARKPIAELIRQRDAAAKEKALFAQQRATIVGEIDAATKLKERAVSRMAVLVSLQATSDDRKRDLEGEVARHESASVELSAKLAKTTKVIDSTVPRLKSAEAEVAATKGKLEELNKKLQAQPKVIASLASQIKQHTASIPALEKQAAAAKKKADDAVAAAAAAKSAVDVATSKLEASYKRLESIRAELVAFASHGKKLESEFAETEAIAVTKRKAVEPEASLASKVAASVQARSEQMNKLAASIAKLQAQVAELQKTQAKEQQTLDAKQAKLAELQEAAEAAEAEAEAKKQKVEFFKSVYGK